MEVKIRKLICEGDQYHAQSFEAISMLETWGLHREYGNTCCKQGR